jgi:hypothetical protein
MLKTLRGGGHVTPCERYGFRHIMWGRNDRVVERACAAQHAG